MRPYQPGDDVRRIDWNVTARTGDTHVRVELAERALITWIVLDGSASMGFGTADRRKADVAEGVALAVGHAATRRGNRLGVVSFGRDEPFCRGRGRGARDCSPRSARCASGLRAAARSRTRCGSPAASRCSGRWSSSSRISAARPTGAPLLQARRAARDARGRDPRPAGAGAGRRRRAAADRPRDRRSSSSSTRRTRECASVRRARRRGPARPRDDIRLGRRAPRRPVHRGRLAHAADHVSRPERPPVSFASP